MKTSRRARLAEALAEPEPLLRLERLLKARWWRKSDARYNVVPPESRRVQVYPSGSRYLRPTVPVYSETLRRGDVVFEAAVASAPEEARAWPLDQVRVVVNRNLRCHPHVDRNDVSFLMLLGDFQGGACVTEDGDRYSEKGVWHRTCPRRLHWTEAFEGERFAVLLLQKSEAWTWRKAEGAERCAASKRRRGAPCAWRSEEIKEG